MLRLYESVTRISHTDARVRSMLMGGEAAFVYYPVRGQECVAAGVGAALAPDDYMVTTYRGLHDSVAKGVPLALIFAEYLGKAAGPCKGKGGPMHLTHPESGLMVTTGVVGGGLPIATGLGLAAKRDGRQRVALCSFGDGASNIGAFHESLNLAALWSLPVVFVCQNNLYAEHTAVEAHLPVKTIAERSASYGMPGVRVDGHDPVAVYEAVREAVALARSGGGPSLIEATCFRFLGHYFGADASYVPADVAAREAGVDGVPRFRERVLADGVATAAQLEEIDARVDQEIESAAAFAKASDPAPLEQTMTDVFAQEVA
jgi:pyruvate dehydrogenase E1 component alpha subunit